MKLQDSYDGIMAEKIAEVALSRTGLVIVQQSLAHNADFIAFRNDKPDEYILVNIKATDCSDEQIKIKYRDYLEDLALQSPADSYLIFFIDVQRQTGYFKILSNRTSKEIYPLRTDLLSRELSNYFSALSGIEFPPYSFYQRQDSSKYRTKPIPVDAKFKILRLYNLTLTPIEKRENFTIKISVEQGWSIDNYSYPLSRQGKLFYNPNLKEFLFFVKDGREFIDISLPDGQKYISVEVESPSNINFEILLSCNYLRSSSER